MIPKNFVHTQNNESFTWESVIEPAPNADVIKAICNPVYCSAAIAGAMIVAVVIAATVAEPCAARNNAERTNANTSSGNPVLTNTSDNALPTQVASNTLPNIPPAPVIKIIPAIGANAEFRISSN